MDNRFALLEESLAQEATRPCDRLQRGLIAQLRDANLAIDILWRAALADQEDRLAIPLAEASRAVHRALAALAPPD